MFPTETLIDDWAKNLKQALRQTGLAAIIETTEQERLRVAWPAGPGEQPDICGLHLEPDPQTARRQLADRSITATVTGRGETGLLLELDASSTAALATAIIEPIASRVAATAYPYCGTDPDDPWTQAITALHEATDALTLSSSRMDIESGKLVLKINLGSWELSAAALKPHQGTVEAVRAGLAEQDIAATVRPSDRDMPGWVCITLDSPQATHALAGAMMGSLPQYQATVSELAHAVRDADLTIEVRLTDRATGSVKLFFTDSGSDLDEDLQALARQLGAENLVAGWGDDFGLKHGGRKRRQRVVDRLAHVLIGATGDHVFTKYDHECDCPHGCEHSASTVSFWLSSLQAQRLTGRLRERPAAGQE